MTAPAGWPAGWEQHLRDGLAVDDEEQTTEPPAPMEPPC